MNGILTQEQQDIVACLVTQAVDNQIFMEQAHTFLNTQFQPWQELVPIQRKTKTNQTLAQLTLKKILRVTPDKKAYLICEKQSKDLKHMLLPSPSSSPSPFSFSRTPGSIDLAQEFPGVLALLASPREKFNPNVLTAPASVKAIWNKQFECMKDHQASLLKFLQHARTQKKDAFLLEDVTRWMDAELTCVSYDLKYLNLALKKLVDEKVLMVFNCFEDYSCNQELCVYHFVSSASS